MPHIVFNSDRPWPGYFRDAGSWASHQLSRLLVPNFAPEPRDLRDPLVAAPFGLNFGGAEGFKFSGSFWRTMDGGPFLTGRGGAMAAADRRLCQFNSGLHP